MDALEILKIDHDCIRELFRSNNPILIHREISIHAQIEAEIFYPALRDKAGDVIEKSLDQHARIEQLLREGTHLVELKRAVEEHLEFEEREAFEQARRYLADDLERLGDQLLKRKEELTAVASSCSDKAGVISERKTGERVSREEIDLGRFESEGGRPSTPPPPV